MSQEMIAALNAYRVARKHHSAEEIAAAEAAINRLEKEETL